MGRFAINHLKRKGDLDQLLLVGHDGIPARSQSVFQAKFTLVIGK